MGGVLWTDPGLKYPSERRQHIKNNEYPIPDTINCYTEYIETPSATVIHCKCLVPKKEFMPDDIAIKAMICICLPYTNHVDWTYTRVAIEWCKRGYIVFLHDSYGHGKSDGDWIFIASFESMVEDAYFVCEYAKRVYTPTHIKNRHRNGDYNNNNNNNNKQKKNRSSLHTQHNDNSNNSAISAEEKVDSDVGVDVEADTKANEKFCYYLLGVSMGGNIALQMTFKYQIELPAVLRSTQANANNNDSSNDTNAKANANANGNIYTTETECLLDARYLWNGLLLVSPLVKIADNLVPHPITQSLLTSTVLPLIPKATIVPTQDLSQYSTSNLASKAFLSHDPLQYVLRPRLRTAMELQNACMVVERQLESLHLPFLVVHGGLDKVTDPNMSTFLHTIAGTTDKKFIKYPNAFHTLFLEDCSGRVFQDMEDWMDEHQ